jgi:hypothetical protein
MTISQACQKVLIPILNTKAIKSTNYISPKFVIKAKRKLYDGKIYKRGNIEIVLTIGKPNYEEHKFIKKYIKVNEPFPVKKIQLKYLKGDK